MNYNMYYTIPYDDKKHLDLLFNFYRQKDQAEKLVHGYFQNISVFRSYLEVKLTNTWSDFRLLMKSDADMAIGFGFFHDLRPTSCSLSIALFDKYQGSGAGVVLAIKMLERAFQHDHDIKRIFEWVFDSNRQSLKLHCHAVNRGILEYHGMLPDQYTQSGISYGTHIFSITRDKFNTILLQVENRLTTY